MSTTHQVQGIVASVTQRKTKTGRNYTTLEVGDHRAYDWDGWCEKKRVVDGNYVVAELTNDKFPKLKGIKGIPKEAAQAQLENKPAPNPVPQGDKKIAWSREYLAMKLAVELVKDEAIAVDEKLIRMEKAYEKIKERL